MVLLIHIFVAIAGVLFSLLYLSFRYNAIRRLAVFSTAGTIISGSLMVVFGSASMLKTCLSGLLYVAIIFALLSYSKKKQSQITTFGSVIK